MLVKFPYSASRRVAARRPRRSKNGTPEERAAARAALGPPAERHDPKPRRSKNGTPEERAAKKLPGPENIIDVTAERAKRVERAMASSPPPMTDNDLAATRSRARLVAASHQMIEARKQEQTAPPEPPTAA
jgi:hypothetical protein